MPGYLDITNITWAATSACEIVLIAVMVRRQFYRSHPAFFLYLILALCQSVLGFEVYRIWGFDNIVAARIIWSSQVILICARGVAVFEIARQVLTVYAGIWKMSRRLMIALACIVVGYSLLFSGRRYYTAITNANRGMELAVGAIVVLLLLLARYYGVVISVTNRMLCTGFCLYSCAFVINFTLFENRQGKSAQLWNFVNIFIYVASLCLWIGAVYLAKETAAGRTQKRGQIVLPETVSSDNRSQRHLLNDRIRQTLHRSQRS
jgi:hypothetical protein